MKMQASGEPTQLTLTVADERKLDDCAYSIGQAKKAIAWKLIDIGRELVAARAIFGTYNAEFLEWAMGTCGICRSRCYECIQVFEKFGSSTTLDGLAISTIVMLSRDTVTEEARQQAIEESKTEPVTAKRAREIVNEHRMEVVSPGGCSAEPEEPEPVGGTDAAVCVDEVQAPVPRQAKASGPQEPNDIGERRFAVRSVVEQQTDGQPAYVRLNIRDLLLDLAEGLKS